jgi:hypothetical protein
VFGRASEDEYHDDIVTRPDMVELRSKVIATIDNSISEASADVTAFLKDGQKIHIFVEHSIWILSRIQ